MGSRKNLIAKPPLLYIANKNFTLQFLEEIEIPGLGGWDDNQPMGNMGPMDSYNNGSDRPIRTGLTLHNDAPPTQEIPAFSQERKKMYVKPVPKDYAKAWEQNKEGEVLQEQGGWGGGNQR